MAVLPNRQAGDPWTPELIKQEHIDLHGHLKVPTNDWFANAPKREGWKPFFVNVVLTRDPKVIYTYRRV